MKAVLAIAVIALQSVSAFIAPSLPVRARSAGCSLQMALEREGMPVNMINPTYFWGEEGYKGYVAGYKQDALVNRIYPILDRVREKKLLTKTAEAGLLSALADSGLTLKQVEALLPALEDAGLLSFAANNAEFLLNTVGFLAVEPAELALPALAAGIRGGPSLFSSLAAGLVVAEAAVAVLTKSIPLSAIAAVPLLGGALALSTVAGILGDLKNGAISIPVRSSSSASSSSYSASPASSAEVTPIFGTAPPKVSGGARPKVGGRAVPQASDYVKPQRVKKAVGNAALLAKRKVKSAVKAAA